MGKLKDIALKTITYTGSAAALVGVVFYEGSLLATVVLLGPLWSFIVLSAVAAIITNSLIYILSSDRNITILKRIKDWSEKKQTTTNPLVARALNVGKLLGVIIAAVTIGPLPTTLLIVVLGYKKPQNYILATSSSMLFCLIWVLIYNGGISCAKSVLKLF